ncbi:helix-turn-helix domain-containing protein [Georgenia daeguensis]|uniref:Helix-turn-helix domain-containing protein n=1 Tax=Georgenia daeguensis TaxID=908355 RepID=A0ABP6UP66_9MICO
MYRWQEVSRLDDLFEGLPEHLSVEELAGVLGVTKQTAYGWLQKGYIPAYKVGPAWMIVRDEVKDHLAAHRNRPLTPQSPPHETD